MLRAHKSIVALFFALCLGAMQIVYCAEEAVQSDPVKLLRYIADNMISGLKAHKATLKTKPHIVYDLAYKYVVPYADLYIMSKHVLPPPIWQSATPDQRSRFEKEFTVTLIRTYASSLTAYNDQTIQFYPVRGGVGANSVVVHSDIHGLDSGPVHVTYRMVKVGKSWKLYDLSVEGVSMLESFRSQFSDILAQGNMEQLLDRMAGHNKQRAQG